ncbi:hypothetical protein, partial [uncultured Candidatus Kuenenia sp.]|uniref:hypothetical protein n=1 Tax=uncultured Candidatus Kuenenia sp. TaxID=1048336 RepID=UPI0025DB4CBB
CNVSLKHGGNHKKSGIHPRKTSRLTSWVHSLFHSKLELRKQSRSQAGQTGSNEKFYPILRQAFSTLMVKQH